ncbi:uncharacterized protein VTP21DRAFT_2871 [Calcarisporiella thermophila]|uniref:uncharacterized protein n=1 Tax=Calcarisporiella thermophila TaxID=911321 RepID=UPI00374300E2
MELEPGKSEADQECQLARTDLEVQKPVPADKTPTSLPEGIPSRPHEKMPVTGKEYFITQEEPFKLSKLVKEFLNDEKDGDMQSEHIKQEEISSMPPQKESARNEYIESMDDSTTTVTPGELSELKSVNVDADTYPEVYDGLAGHDYETSGIWHADIGSKIEKHNELARFLDEIPKETTKENIYEVSAHENSAHDIDDESLQFKKLATNTPPDDSELMPSATPHQNSKSNETFGLETIDLAPSNVTVNIPKRDNMELPADYPEKESHNSEGAKELDLIESTQDEPPGVVGVYGVRDSAKDHPTLDEAPSTLEIAAETPTLADIPVTNDPFAVDVQAIFDEAANSTSKPASDMNEHNFVEDNSPDEDMKRSSVVSESVREPATERDDNSHNKMLNAHGPLSIEDKSISGDLYQGEEDMEDGSKEESVSLKESGVSEPSPSAVKANPEERAIIDLPKPQIQNEVGETTAEVSVLFGELIDQDCIEEDPKMVDKKSEAVLGPKLEEATDETYEINYEQGEEMKRLVDLARDNEPAKEVIHEISLDSIENPSNIEEPLEEKSSVLDSAEYKEGASTDINCASEDIDASNNINNPKAADDVLCLYGKDVETNEEATPELNRKVVSSVVDKEANQESNPDTNIEPRVTSENNDAEISGITEDLETINEVLEPCDENIEPTDEAKPDLKVRFEPADFGEKTGDSNDPTKNPETAKEIEEEVAVVAEDELDAKSSDIDPVNTEKETEYVHNPEVNEEGKENMLTVKAGDHASFGLEPVTAHVSRKETEIAKGIPESRTEVIEHERDESFELPVVDEKIEEFSANVEHQIIESMSRNQNIEEMETEMKDETRYEPHSTGLAPTTEFGQSVESVEQQEGQHLAVFHEKIQENDNEKDPEVNLSAEKAIDEIKTGAILLPAEEHEVRILSRGQIEELPVDKENNLSTEESLTEVRKESQAGPLCPTSQESEITDGLAQNGSVKAQGITYDNESTVASLDITQPVTRDNSIDEADLDREGLEKNNDSTAEVTNKEFKKAEVLSDRQEPSLTANNELLKVENVLKDISGDNTECLAAISAGHSTEPKIDPREAITADLRKTSPANALMEAIREESSHEYEIKRADHTDENSATFQDINEENQLRQRKGVHGHLQSASRDLQKEDGAGKSMTSKQSNLILYVSGAIVAVLVGAGLAAYTFYIRK